MKTVKTAKPKTWHWRTDYEDGHMESRRDGLRIRVYRKEDHGAWEVWKGETMLARCLDVAVYESILQSLELAKLEARLYADGFLRGQAWGKEGGQ